MVPLDQPRCIIRKFLLALTSYFVRGQCHLIFIIPQLWVRLFHLIGSVITCSFPHPTRLLHSLLRPAVTITINICFHRHVSWKFQLNGLEHYQEQGPTSENIRFYFKLKLRFISSIFLLRFPENCYPLCLRSVFKLIVNMKVPGVIWIIQHSTLQNENLNSSNFSLDRFILAVSICRELLLRFD